MIQVQNLLSLFEIYSPPLIKSSLPVFLSFISNSLYLFEGQGYQEGTTKGILQASGAKNGTIS